MPGGEGIIIHWDLVDLSGVTPLKRIDSLPHSEASPYQQLLPSQCLSTTWLDLVEVLCRQQQLAAVSSVLSCSEDIIFPRSSLSSYSAMVPDGREDSLL